jgi:hypothetical protein
MSFNLAVFAKIEAYRLKSNPLLFKAWWHFFMSYSFDLFIIFVVIATKFTKRAFNKNYVKYKELKLIF